MADEKTMEKKNHRKLMEKKMLDEKIKRFLSKVESVSGSIAWFAEQHVDSFPQGFISSFLENFIKYKAAVEKMRTLSVSKSQVEMAIASAIAENKKKATNKPSKKDSKKKKNSKTVVKKTDFKSVQKAVLADLSKARDLSVAKCIMLRKAKLFSYAEVFCFPPMLFFSEEEIMLAEEERLRDEEERIRAEEERIRAKEESRKVKEEKLAKMEAEKRSKKKESKKAKKAKKLAFKGEKKTRKFAEVGHLIDHARNTSGGR